MIISSAAFKHEGTVPREYTCMGEDISPPLQWDGIPDGTKSLTLIMDDPDAPMGTWVHWIMYGIDPAVREIPENIPNDFRLRDGSVQGIGSNGRYGYHGPCPPSGVHRYYFRLYALDTILKPAKNLKKDNLLAMMEGHILSTTELMARFSRR